MQTRVGSAIWRCEHRYPIVMSTREGGKLARCREDLTKSLVSALKHDSPRKLYPLEGDREREPCEGLGNRQWCYDAIRHTETGAISQPPIHWVDRPTFQQAVEPGK